MANKKLNEEHISKILHLIYGWRRKPFKWELIVERIKTDHDINISRQQLSQEYPEIKDAYKTKIQALRGKPSEEFISFTKSDVDLHQSLNKKEKEIQKLEMKCDRLVALIDAIKERATNNPLLLQVLNDTLEDLRR
jgi:intein-encoded DNA endonuclease-like protein